MSRAESVCQECGMVLSVPTEYHPYAACLMFKASRDSLTARANLHHVVNHGRELEAKDGARKREIQRASRKAVPGE